MWRRLTFSIVVVLVSGSGALAQQPHEVYTCKGSCTTESGQNGHRLMECRFTDGRAALFCHDTGQCVLKCP
jgi:hypothetical protein